MTKRLQLPCYRTQLTDIDSDVNYLGGMRVYSFISFTAMHQRKPEIKNQEPREGRNTRSGSVYCLLYRNKPEGAL